MHRTVATTGHPRYGHQFDPGIHALCKYGTHLSMLCKYMSIIGDRLLWPDGILLEHGTGRFSTPLFDMYMDVFEIGVCRIENKPELYEQTSITYAQFRDVWASAPLDYIPIALIDGDADERQPMIDLIKDRCAYLIVHDVEPDQRKHYKWTFDTNDCLEIDTTIKPWTACIRGGKAPVL